MATPNLFPPSEREEGCDERYPRVRAGKPGLKMPYRLLRDKADTLLLAFSPLPTGLTIALFNDRFTSRSWRFAGGIGYPLWSGILLICGLSMLICLLGRRTERKHSVLVGAMALTGLWWFSLGLLFLITAIIDPLANPLGAVAWWTICGFYVLWVWHERKQSV